MSPWHVTLLQMENGILLPTLQSALPFLDLHGTPRLEFHQSVFDELREKLMERVAVIAEGKEEDRSVIGCVLVFLIYLYACWGNQCFYDFFFFCSFLLSIDTGSLKNCSRRASHLLKCHLFSRWWCRSWSIYLRQVFQPLSVIGIDP